VIPFALQPDDSEQNAEANEHINITSETELAVNTSTTPFFHADMHSSMGVFTRNPTPTLARHLHLVTGNLTSRWYR